MLTMHSMQNKSLSLPLTMLARVNKAAKHSYTTHTLPLDRSVLHTSVFPWQRRWCKCQYQPIIIMSSKNSLSTKCLIFPTRPSTVDCRHWRSSCCRLFKLQAFEISPGGGWVWYIFLCHLRKVSAFVYVYYDIITSLLLTCWQLSGDAPSCRNRNRTNYQSIHSPAPHSERKGIISRAHSTGTTAVLQRHKIGAAADGQLAHAMWWKLSVSRERARFRDRSWWWWCWFWLWSSWWVPMGIVVDRRCAETEDEFFQLAQGWLNTVYSLADPWPSTS